MSAHVVHIYTARYKEAATTGMWVDRSILRRLFWARRVPFVVSVVCIVASLILLFIADDDGRGGMARVVPGALYYAWGCIAAAILLPMLLKWQLKPASFQAKLLPDKQVHLKFTHPESYQAYLDGCAEFVLKSKELTHQARLEAAADATESNAAAKKRRHARAAQSFLKKRRSRSEAEHDQGPGF